MKLRILKGRVSAQARSGRAEHHRRRENLGISQARLAEMAGVSMPTVQRLLSGSHHAVSFDTA